MRIFFTLFTLLFSLAVSATPINKIVVFGDSLSDNGNFYEYMKKQFPTAPYYEGRFTNGPVWIELVANAKETELFDYAFGGAGVLDPVEDPDSALFNLHQEVNSYFLANEDKADADALYIVWIGSNNYLAMPEDDDKALSIVLGGIKTEVQRLVDKGAKHIVVVNLPDLGKTPVAYDYNANDKLSILAIDHNVALLQQVEEFQKAYPEVQWLYLNVGSMFSELILGPESFGFNKETLKDTCFDKYPPSEDIQNASPTMMGLAASLIKQAKGQVDPCDGYLFFDPVHPTALAHKILSERTLQDLDNAGFEFAKKTVNS
ncbi:SGNH/GDSL hydrolase family protein [Legionella impletisoli]|uniref:Lysophospholipase n=1 Tax=Legionella impletisoli TaxID=343510 RepID=A0A917JVW1_9GAMM|nr:SGNH/GDSL hydrolase family protein [Legionella impletisoli]GGI86204.1 lysophospholipase [Legionella impletisoli]